MRIKVCVGIVASALVGLAGIAPAHAQVGYGTNAKGELSLVDCASGAKIRIENSDAVALSAVVAGVDYTVIVDCYMPNTTVTVNLLSSVGVLGQITTDGSDHGKLPVKFDCDTPMGGHTLRGDGTARDGAPASASQSLKLSACGTSKEAGEKKLDPSAAADATSGSPAFTGSNFGTQVGLGAGLLAGGAGLVVAFRRRRSQSAA